MDEKGDYWFCPNFKDDSTTKCFVIHKSKVVEVLTDSEHPANKCLSEHERALLSTALTNILHGETNKKSSMANSNI